MERSRIARIRANERAAHLRMYRSGAPDGWINRPVRAVTELLPQLKALPALSVLDLGCGVGRNALPIARAFCDRPCRIECVDILPEAIRQLSQNAAAQGVSAQIHGIVRPIEHFPICAGQYDLILAISALEHIDTPAHFRKKLTEIKDGLKPGGTACLLLNSSVRAWGAAGEEAEPPFECNFAADALHSMLFAAFNGFMILRSDISDQTYRVPQADGEIRLQTRVVTFVAKREADV